ncbi:MAG TPA: HAMP domain-containing sensor histidine kinase [Alphaproteobacteria bacterium]
MPLFGKSLSARLLLLTIFFVMLSEVLIYAPSVARYRREYLDDRLAAGHLATLALAAAPDHRIMTELEIELLDHAHAYAVVRYVPNMPKLMLIRDMPPAVNATYDLREDTMLSLIYDAFVTLVQPKNRVLRVLGDSPKAPHPLIEVVLDEAPLRDEMLAFSERILALSIIISLFTAALVYLSLQWLLVRPMRALTQNMTAFSEAPEDETRIIVPSGRSDEIGIAERQLQAMQHGLRAALRQKAHLAALGAAVARINHDLRNILSSASLMSDRLAHIEAPEVKRIAPVLIRAIDRAVTLCTETLDFASGQGPAPKLAPVPLRSVVDEVGAALPNGNGRAVLENAVDAGLEVKADRTQLFRVLSNLGTNAVQAGAAQVRISAERQNGRVYIDVADDGPGLSEAARERLFQPFARSTRSGGTGLGLAIAKELVQAHGGDIILVETSTEGTRFRVELPAD